MDSVRAAAGNGTAGRVCGAMAALALAAAVQAQTGGPNVLYVDDDAPPGGSGSSWNAAYRDLQDALDSCRAKHLTGAIEIRIAEGLYTPDRGTLDRTKFFDVGISNTSSITVTLTMLGGFVGLGGLDHDFRDPKSHPTVLSGDLRHNDLPGWQNREDNSRCVVRVLAVHDTLWFDGLTIRGGENDFPNDVGGGVAIQRWNSPFNVGPVFQGCDISDNHSFGYEGAGLSIELNGASLRHCTLSNNFSEGDGGCGGVYLGGYSTVNQITDCRFTGNRGEYVGAVLCGEDIHMSRCTLLDNTGGHGPGAVLGGYLTADNCLFAGNETQGYGGAVSLTYWGSYQLTNCTFVGNRAAYGGAAFIERSGKIKNCLMWDNYATIGGDSLAIDTPGSSPQFDHNIIQGGAASFYGFWSNLGWGPTNNSADPWFRDRNGPDGDPDTWGDNDLRPAPGSPCIDSGDDGAASLSAIDIDGRPRKYNAPGGTSLIDIGCYEAQKPACLADFNFDHFVTGDDWDLFVEEFQIGNRAADVDWNTFVNGDDYDLFAQHFVNGC